MKAWELSDLIQTLKRVRDDATMKNARFHVGEEPFPFGADVSDLVRQATRLWRDSWVVGPLTEVIEKLEKQGQ